jgi:hypothetical protein
MQNIMQIETVAYAAVLVTNTVADNQLGSSQ